MKTLEQRGRLADRSALQRNGHQRGRRFEMAQPQADRPGNLGRACGVHPPPECADWNRCRRFRVDPAWQEMTCRTTAATRFSPEGVGTARRRHAPVRRHAAKLSTSRRPSRGAATPQSATRPASTSGSTSAPRVPPPASPPRPPPPASRPPRPAPASRAPASRPPRPPPSPSASRPPRPASRLPPPGYLRRARSISSSVLGQSDLSSRDNARSASKRPSV